MDFPMEETHNFRVMNPEQKLVVVLSKEKEAKTPQILAEYIRKWQTPSLLPGKRSSISVGIFMTIKTSMIRDPCAVEGN